MMKKIAVLVGFVMITAAVVLFRYFPERQIVEESIPEKSIPEPSVVEKPPSAVKDPYQDWPGRYRQALRVLRAGSQDPVWGLIPNDVGPDAGMNTAIAAEGQRLAAGYCSQCHMSPEPTDLPTVAWATWLLQKAILFQGAGLLEHSANEPDPQDLVLQNMPELRFKRDPESVQPTPIPRAAFAKILYGYLVNSSATGAPQPPATATTEPAPFRVKTWQPEGEERSRDYGAVTIDERHGRFFLGAQFGEIEEHDAGGAIRQQWHGSPGVTHIALSDDVLLLTCIGATYGGHKKEGRVLTRAPIRNSKESVLVDKLYRPLSTLVVPGRGKRKALLINEFGYETGSLSWFKPAPKGVYKKTDLTSTPGIVGVALGDYDGDGTPDILSAASQADEGVDFLKGIPGGGYAEPRRLLRFPPTYGTNSLTVADLDGDKKIEIITTQGDNFDLFSAPLKGFHGLRIFSGNPTAGYQLAFFYPMHGAIQSIAADFDGDGDADLAAIAFSIDPEAPRGFLYLENTGGMQFVAHRFAEVEAMGWIAMSAGDLDQDGRPELVLTRIFGDAGTPKWVLLAAQ